MLNMNEIKNAAREGGHDHESIVAKNVKLIENEITKYARLGEAQIYRSQFWGSYSDGCEAANRVVADNDGLSVSFHTNSFGVPYVKFTW